jgi:hypothetical protein
MLLAGVIPPAPFFRTHDFGRAVKSRYPGDILAPPPTQHFPAGLASSVDPAGPAAGVGEGTVSPVGIVEVRGFEPLASSVRGKRSAGLSYTPRWARNGRGPGAKTVPTVDSTIPPNLSTNSRS